MSMYHVLWAADASGRPALVAGVFSIGEHEDEDAPRG